ncbi:hypothetical protein [Fontivita pretiosa]|uniref:hypothetical protein n=1 Tax=Fontivita pretiosa TaxID=2989684 RepID=UPI003D1624EB
MNKRGPGERAVRRAVQRLEGDPRFLAWVFASLRRLETAATAASADAIARRLGVRLERLDELALCPLPREEHFAQDVAALAGEFGLNASALAAMVRQVQVLRGISIAPEHGAAGSLLAARRRQRPSRRRRPGENG